MALIILPAAERRPASRLRVFQECLGKRTTIKTTHLTVAVSRHDWDYRQRQKVADISWVEFAP